MHSNFRSDNPRGGAFSEPQENGVGIDALPNLSACRVEGQKVTNFKGLNATSDVFASVEGVAPKARCYNGLWHFGFLTSAYS
jgi:hypothetical protein